MSSYQFVNTLAQCYEANAQLQGGAVPGAGGVAGGGTDYYGMQYPSCYSPATQGYSTPAAPGQASVAAPGAYPGTMMGPGQAPPPGGPGASSEYSHAPPSSSTTSLVSGPPSSSATRPRSPGATP